LSVSPFEKGGAPSTGKRSWTASTPRSCRRSRSRSTIRIQQLHELEPENFELPPSRTEAFTQIEIAAFPGRSAAAKKRLYQAIVENLSRSPGIAPTDVLILLHEPPLYNWGIRGGQPASEVSIGFKLDV
jgi:phenylpyruvate tautomerase PptA (4-oxalocrotonate tautomerase family)